MKSSDVFIAATAALLLAGCADGGVSNPATASTAAPAAQQGAASRLNPEQEKLLSNLRFAIDVKAQPAFDGIDPENLTLEDGVLILRARASEVRDAYALCDSLLASSGGYGLLSPTRLYVDGRLAAESVFDSEGSADCENR